MCVLATAARAQTGIYAEFTGGKIPSANTPWMYGPTVGLYHDNGFGPIALGLDVRGSFLRRGDTNGADTHQSLNTLEGGVRLAITPHVLPVQTLRRGARRLWWPHYRAGDPAHQRESSHLPVSRRPGFHLLSPA